MNLYQLHTNPESLYKHNEAPYRVPSIAYELAAEKYRKTGKRTHKLESVIAQDPQWAFWYARFVIKERWPEAEPVIAQDPYSAYDYARWVMQSRWPEAETVIAQDPELWELYKRYFEIK